nr:competence protein CoiA family protein [Alteripontixanthobacter muriae]
MSRPEWDALATENKFRRHLHMPCCNAAVSLKRSRRGTPFFAHVRRGECTTAPETEEHMLLKRLIVESARRDGWNAVPEVQGTSPIGDWRADVLAIKDARKVAVEVQWSSQTATMTLERQERYRAGGVEGVWLIRQPGFPISRDLPAVVLGGKLPELTALLPADEEASARHRSEPEHWLQVLPIDEFLNALFGGRFWFGPAIGTPASVHLLGGLHYCYRCGAEGTVVSYVNLVTEHDRCWFSLRELGKVEAVWPEFNALLISAKEPIRFAYRTTKRGERYLCNECIHCGAFTGQNYIQGLIGRVAVIDAVISPAWRKAACRHAITFPVGEFTL